MPSQGSAVLVKDIKVSVSLSLSLRESRVTLFLSIARGLSQEPPHHRRDGLESLPPPQAGEHRLERRLNGILILALN